MKGAVQTGTHGITAMKSSKQQVQLWLPAISCRFHSQKWECPWLSYEKKKWGEPPGSQGSNQEWIRCHAPRNKAYCVCVCTGTFCAFAAEISPNSHAKCDCVTHVNDYILGRMVGSLPPALWRWGTPFSRVSFHTPREWGKRHFQNFGNCSETADMHHNGCACGSYQRSVVAYLSNTAQSWWHCSILQSSLNRPTDWTTGMRRNGEAK